jgi:hypothetical protein
LLTSYPIRTAVPSERSESKDLSCYPIRMLILPAPSEVEGSDRRESKGSLLNFCIATASSSALGSTGTLPMPHSMQNERVDPLRHFSYGDEGYLLQSRGINGRNRSRARI